MTEPTENKGIQTITGALGFTGKYIARQLIEKGFTVQTLTNSPERPNPFGEKIRILPLDFSSEKYLSESLRGTDILYVTYWVRFPYNRRNLSFSYAQAEENTKKLFDAAKKAGVKKIVYISISNADETLPYEYFSRKASIEKYLIASGMQYVILRPCVIFGKEDILFNNIAWALRNFPVFPVFKGKECKIQPIYVNDLATMAIQYAQAKENIILDACGPETYQYSELAKLICKILNKKRWIITLPASWIYFAGKIISLFTGDALLTKDELGAVRNGLMYSRNKPTASTQFSEWLKENKSSAGVRYANETKRRFNPKLSY